jgi:hypothetical protein
MKAPGAASAPAHGLTSTIQKRISTKILSDRSPPAQPPWTGSLLLLQQDNTAADVFLLDPGANKPKYLIAWRYRSGTCSAKSARNCSNRISIDHLDTGALMKIKSTAPSASGAREPSRLTVSLKVAFVHRLAGRRLDFSFFTCRATSFSAILSMPRCRL